MHNAEGFLLGLSTGVVCLAYCGPVLIPFLMGEGRDTGSNFLTVALFLAGRFLAYVLVGLISGMLGLKLIHPTASKNVIFGCLYILLSALLIAYGFYRFKEVCLGMKQDVVNKKYAKRWPVIVPAAGGFTTGLNICPPFLLAVTGAMESGTVYASIVFFILFFAGTSVYFLPLPFIGFFRKQQAWRAVGKFSAMLAGLVYLYKGIMMIITSHSLI